MLEFRVSVYRSLTCEKQSPEVTASNSAGIEKVKLALEVVLTDKERRRIMAMCRRELTHPEVDLPTVKPGPRSLAAN